jgi:hypothetical protein
VEEASGSELPGGAIGGRAACYSGLSAHTSSWCLLEPFRVVFHSFHGYNYLLPSGGLFGVYDSGPGAVFWINPPAYKYSPKLMKFISLNSYTYVW